jgi:alcohol dehydrogenase (cytochrome c)
MGANWPPSSYDPRTHRMFICGTDHVGVSASDGKEEFPPPGEDRFWAGGGNLSANHGVARLGTFNAMDLTTNRLVWQQQWNTSCMAGTLATGGGLVFVGRTDGRFTALDTDTGHRLWSFQTDAGVAASASTFEYQGRQYVAVLSAGTLIGNGQHGDSLWLFSLDGKVSSLSSATGGGRGGGTPGAGAPAAAATLRLPAGPADLAQGKQLFGQLCAGCHGDNGTGTSNGASLAIMGRDRQMVADTAWNGRKLMPAFRTALTPEQVRDVASYIAEQLFPEHP